MRRVCDDAPSPRDGLAGARPTRMVRLRGLDAPYEYDYDPNGTALALTRFPGIPLRVESCRHEHQFDHAKADALNLHPQLADLQLLGQLGVQGFVHPLRP